MKINSRKFLIFSYALSGKYVTYEHLTFLWPDISSGGRRGLIAHLLKQRLILVSYKGKTAQFSLSPIGKAWVEEEYFTKTLHDSSPGYLVMLYSDVSHSDPKYLKLRALLKSQLNEVSPKVFYSSQSLNDELLTQIKKNYFSIAAVVSLREWLVGDRKLFENYYLQNKFNENSLSGVSRELDELISKKTSFLDSNHQSKVLIFSLLDRIIALIDENSVSLNLSEEEIPPARKLLGYFSSLF